MLAEGDFVSSVAFGCILIVLGVIGGFWYCRRSKA
mgnify:FL=1